MKQRVFSAWGICILLNPFWNISISLISFLFILGGQFLFLKWSIMGKWNSFVLEILHLFNLHTGRPRPKRIPRHGRLATRSSYALHAAFSYIMITIISWIIGDQSVSMTIAGQWLVNPKLQRRFSPLFPKYI